jgi:hypothetical protein
MASGVSEFVGSAEPFSAATFSDVTNRLDVEPAAIWAVLAVETSGCGFLPDRRPKILFERHVFHKQTGGRFDSEAPDISNSQSGGYGAGGAHQYDRLAGAINLDRTAALKSSSWGLGQTMGFNFAELGFDNVELMVTAIKQSEDSHLVAMERFIKDHGIDQALKSHRWADFASVYNGPNFEDNNYDGKLRDNFSKYSKGSLPDLIVRSAQIFLMYLDLKPGAIDGVLGPTTGSPLKQAGLHDSVVNEATIVSLKEMLGKRLGQGAA